MELRHGLLVRLLWRLPAVILSGHSSSPMAHMERVKAKSQQQLASHGMNYLDSKFSSPSHAFG